MNLIRIITIITMNNREYGNELPKITNEKQWKHRQDLVQPFTKDNKKNIEFIKRYGDNFYKDKPQPKIETPEPANNKNGVVLTPHSRGGVTGLYD